MKKGGKNLDTISDDEAVESLLTQYVLEDDLEQVTKDFEEKDMKYKAVEILKFLTLGTHNIKNIKSVKMSKNSISWKIITKNDTEENYSSDKFKTS